MIDWLTAGINRLIDWAVINWLLDQLTTGWLLEWWINPTIDWLTARLIDWLDVFIIPAFLPYVIPMFHFFVLLLPTDLRMQLLDPETNCYLVRALYGILMLLPQSEAFDTLKRRLDCVPLLQRVSRSETVTTTSNNRRTNSATEKTFFNDLLKYFVDTQTRQQASLRRERNSQS